MILIKFTPAKYEESLMSGKLYMNALDWFWKNGFEAQNDIFEGISGHVKLEHIRHVFPPELRDHIVSDIAVQPVAYGSCNIFCMSRIDLQRIGQSVRTTTPGNMAEFGDRAIIVNNNREFFRRIHAAVNARGFQYVCGDVIYSAPRLNGNPATKKSRMKWRNLEPISLENLDTCGIDYVQDAFTKHTKYAYQNEWRIVMCRDTKDNQPCCLEIGDISDIAFSVDGQKVADNAFLEALARNADFTHYDYRGNTTRDALRTRFTELSEGKYWFFMNI